MNDENHDNDRESMYLCFVTCLRKYRCMLVDLVNLKIFFLHEHDLFLSRSVRLNDLIIHHEGFDNRKNIFISSYDYRDFIINL